MPFAEGLGASAFGVAALAGAASLASPCVLPLVPGYLSLISGVALSDLEHRRTRVLVAALTFVLGFALVFSLAGAGIALVGEAFRRHGRLLEIIAGLLIIVLGMLAAGVVPLRWLERERRLFRMRPLRGVAGSFLTGAAFALGWTPCVGPALASILTLAASGRDPGLGALLLFTYSLGLGVPFILSGVVFTQLLGMFGWFRRHARLVRAFFGCILIVYGALVALGRLNWTLG